MIHPKIRQTAFISKNVLLLACSFFIWISSQVPLCYADAPYEQFYFTIDQMDADSLKNIKGILTIDFTDPAYYKTERSNNPARIQMFDKPGHKTMRFLKIENAHPVSGIEWDGGLSWRFPVVATSGEYIQIVFDVKSNLRTWLQMKTISVEKDSETNKPLNTLFNKDQRCTSNLIMFDSLGNEPMPADLLSLFKDKTRTFYTDPVKNANGFTDVDQKHEILCQKAKERGYLNSAGFYVSEIKNDYARITDRFYNETLEFISFTIGWIRLYDDNQRLTIWYQYRQIP